MRKAKIYLKYSFEGEMTKSSDDKFPGDNSNPIEINIKISNDARIRDIEKLFGELQDKILFWTRGLDTDHKYVVENELVSVDKPKKYELPDWLKPRETAPFDPCNDTALPLKTDNNYHGGDIVWVYE